MLPLLLQFFLFSDGTELSAPIPDSLVVKLKENYTNNINNAKAGGKLYRQYGIFVTLERDSYYYVKGSDSSIAYPDVPGTFFISDTFFIATSGPVSMESGMRFFFNTFI
ncbi:MAG: hypothetical protein L6Q77_14255 [Bacteroidetes bacterium]|nr:hypothetical protein [Bacteroidota bacterium]